MKAKLIILFALALVPFTSTALAQAGGAAAQDPGPPPVDNRPELKAMVDEMTGHIAKRGKEDHEAIGVIDKLVQEFPKSGPKDRGSIVKALDKCFSEKRQEDENGVFDNQLYIAAATALGEMAPESVPVLLSWIGNKAHRKDLKLQRVLILKLGKTKNEAGREPLINLLVDKDAQIIAAAAEALGEYSAIDQKLRKATFDELLKVLMGAKGAVDSNANDTIARERYDMIAAPIVTSLTRLSAHEEHDPNEWQRWWNKNKKEDWDAGK
jgi:hypothetical protein